MNSNKITKFIIPISFLILPLLLLSLPTYKKFIISITELITEGIALICLYGWFLYNEKNNKINHGSVFLFSSLLCVCFADLIYNLRLLEFLPQEYDIYGDILYSFFAFFLNLFVIIKLNLLHRKSRDWIWCSMFAFIINALLNYRFNLAPYTEHSPLTSTDLISVLIPYFHTNHTLLWKINSTIYLFFTLTLFSLIIPFIYRITNRIDFWIFNCILLLLIADIEIRYQDNFVNTFSFSWAELAWCSSFIGITWLIFLSRNTSKLIKTPGISSIVSIRSLLTLAILGANIFFLFEIIVTDRYSINNAIDVNRTLFLVFMFWSIANEFSIWLTKDLMKILNGMFISKENFFYNKSFRFTIKKVPPQNLIFEISQIVSAYNLLVEQTNKLIEERISDEKNKALFALSASVAHDIRSPLATFDIILNDIKNISGEHRTILENIAQRIKDIANNLLVQYKENRLLGQQGNTVKLKVTALEPLLRNLIAEKKTQYKNLSIILFINLGPNISEKFVTISPTAFNRTISNILDNSAEASAKNIFIRLTQINIINEEKLLLQIHDDGSGIENEILQKINNGEIISTKKDGHGLGLTSITRTIHNDWDGQFNISSTLNDGTCLEIILPVCIDKMELVTFSASL